MPIYLTLALTFFNFVGANAARVLLTLYALTLGASPAAVGLLGGMFYLFPLLLSLPIGALADRFGSRGLLMIGSLCGMCALVLPYFVREMAAFYVAAALTGMALAFFHVTLQNLMGILSRPNEHARNFSNFSLVGASTNFVGPLVAGFSIDYAGHAIACLYIAALSLTAILMLVVWGRLLPGGNRSIVGGTGTALRTLGDREVRRMLFTSGMSQLGTDLFQFYMPIYGYGIGLSASVIGTLLAAFAGASFVVRLFLAWMVRRFPAEKLLACSFYLGAIGFMLVPFFRDTLMLAAIAFVFGLGMGIGTPLTVILMFSRSADGRSGQTLGLRLTANNFVRVVGPMVFGAVGSAFGLPAVFWINALVMGCGGLMSRSRPDGPKKDNQTQKR